MTLCRSPHGCANLASPAVDTPERQRLEAFISGISGKNVLYQGMQGGTEILQYACQKSLALIADFCIDGALEEWSKVLEALTCQHCHLDDAGNLDNQA